MTHNKQIFKLIKQNLNFEKSDFLNLQNLELPKTKIEFSKIVF